MSESGDDSSDAGKKRSSFGFQFDKFQDRMSSKISNPFKKDKSDSDSDSGGKSPPKSTPSPVLESLKESSAPPVPPRPEVVQAEAVNNVLKVEDVPTAGAQVRAVIWSAKGGVMFIGSKVVSVRLAIREVSLHVLSHCMLRKYTAPSLPLELSMR